MATTKEKRVHPRLRCRFKGRCRNFLWNDYDMAWQASARDLSRGGVRCVLERRFEVGTILKLELTAAEEEHPSKVLLVRVVRVCDYPKGRWEIGCQLHRDLDEWELRELMS